jgi:hypothetical protein
MRIPRVLGGRLAAAVCASAWLVAGPGIGPAGADCAGPQLEVAPVTAAPGQWITVAGLYFGDDCNDTGGPGPALGQPLQDVELWIRVGESEKQVAVVDAGIGYDFAVQVVVPPSLGAGSGTVTASTGGFWASPASAPIVVEGAPVREDDPPIFDADRFAASTGSGSDPRGSDPSPTTEWPWVLVGAFGGAAFTLGVVAVVRRRPS